MEGTAQQSTGKVKAHSRFSGFNHLLVPLGCHNNISQTKKLCCCRLVAKSCPTLCNLRDCSPPGASVHVISQAATLEWVAISFSGGIFLTQGLNPHLLHW